MISRYDVTLNGTRMAEISNKILILDVQYEPPQYARNLFQRANRNGALVGKAYKQRAAVSIVFEIHEYDIAERQRILARIIKWAKNGGDLRINDRVNQKLICICDELPAIESVRDWTSELTITFAAYAIPYWQYLGVQMETVTLASGTEADYSADEGFVSKNISPDFTYQLSNAPYAFLDVEVAVPEGANPGNMIEIENNLSPDGRFTIENGSGVISPKYIASFVIATDENGLLRAYKHIYDPDTSSYEDDSKGMWNKGKNDEIRLVSGETNTVRIRYGQRIDNLFTPYAAQVTFKVRWLFE